MKITLDEMTEKVGVHLRYHTNAVMPIMDGDKVLRIFIESKSGCQAILSKVIINCTGDVDIDARAGQNLKWVDLRMAHVSQCQ